MSAKPDLAIALQRGAKFLGVVDLAVVSEHVAAAGGDHRLVPSGREVHDGEPAGPERYTGGRVQPHAFIVGTAMHQRSDHHARNRPQRLGRTPSAVLDASSKTAHRFNPRGNVSRSE